MAGILILLFGYVFSQFYRSFLSVLTPLLRQELGMSIEALSVASGMWFAVFALAQFAVGKWLDTYGPRRTAGRLFLFGGAGGAALFALANGPVMIIIAMGLIGLGCSPVLMATYYIFAKQYSPARFAMLASLFVGLGSLGNIAGAQPLAELVAIFGWRSITLVLAAITGALALLIFVLVRDPAFEDKNRGKGSVLDVLKIRQLWPILPLVLGSYGAAAGIRGLWVGPYMEEIHSLDVIAIGQTVLAMAITMSVGSLIYGPLDRLFDTRKWVIIFGNLGGFIALLALIFWPQPSVLTATILFAIIGLFFASYGVTMAHGKAFFPPHLTGRGVTLLNFFSIGGTALMQFVSGRVFNLAGAGEQGFEAVFIAYTLAIGIGIAIYFFAKDVRPSTE